MLAAVLGVMLFFAIVCLIAVGFEVDECDSKGGVMVQTFTGYTCVQRK